MGQIVVVAEKPSVGRDLARVLGCQGRAQGALVGNGYAVTWALGHLIALQNPDQIDPQYQKWRMESLPILPGDIPREPVKKTREQLEVICSLLRDPHTTSVICATDSGREGELIFRYIYQYAQCGLPVQRLWISSMTDAAIREGFASLRDAAHYDGLYESARCRAQADWLVGMNGTRAFTLRSNTLLSIGRVQTPTLAILAARRAEIEAFVPKDYYQLRADFGDYHGLWWDQKSNSYALATHGEADAIAQAVAGMPAQVADVGQKPGKTPPPQLFDLTELQRQANVQYGYSAAKTLSIAQELYERYKCITYPRTDSRYITADLTPTLPKLVRAVGVGRFEKAGEYLMSLPALPITARIVNDKKVSDHHAILPTGKSGASLAADAAQIYEMVVRQFLAAFYPEYRYTTTRVMTVAAEHPFVSRGQVVVQWGWKELFKEAKVDKPQADEEDVALEPLPSLHKGDMRRVEDTEIAYKQTKPPKNYTESTLLSAMEHAGRLVDDEALAEQLRQNGLGTPATRAAIIERLIQVGYVRRGGKALLVTDKGMRLIEKLPAEIKSPEMTGKWERGLALIAENKMNPERFLQSIERYVRYLVDAARGIDPLILPADEGTTKKKNAPQKGAPAKKRAGTAGQKAGEAAKRPPALGSCPLCKQGKVRENSQAFGCDRYQQGCRFTLWKNALSSSDGPDLDASTVKKLLAKGSVPLAGGEASLNEGRLNWTKAPV